MKTLKLNVWGKEHDVTFTTNEYAENGNLYVGIVCFDDGYPEPWSDLTVNLSVKCESNCAFIDTNNNGAGIINWLEDYGIAKSTGRMKQSGFCTYPEVRFDLEKLVEHRYVIRS